MTSEPHHHRWYQFRLRTLLVVMTLSAIPFAWVGSKVRQAQREKPVIAWAEKMGGFAGTYEGGWLDKWVGGTVQSVNLDDTQVSDLSPLAGLKTLTSLYLGSTPVSDEQVEILQKALPNCKISHSTRAEK